MSAVAKDFIFEAVGAYWGAGFGKLYAVDGSETAVFFYFVGILGFEGLGFFVELGFEILSFSEKAVLFNCLEGGYGGGAD